MLNIILANILMLIDIDWSDYTDPIYRLFMGNETTTGILGNDAGILLAAFIFLIFLILTLMFGLGMLVGAVILIPASFAAFSFYPSFRIVFAILAGLIFGLALHKLVRR